jgi:probable rRNA maturation factor
MIFFVENGTDFDPAAECGIDDVSTFCGRLGEAVLAGEGITGTDGLEASLYLVSGEEIRELNRTHRDRDEETDVLSFPNIDTGEGESLEAVLSAPDADITDPESGRVLFGEIVINTERVRRQAEEYGHSVRREFAFLVTHSLLHLAGYDHMTPEEAAVMEQKQEAVLTSLGIGRDG